MKADTLSENCDFRIRGQKPRLAATDATEALRFLRSLRPNGPWVLTAIIPDGETTTKTFDDEQKVRQFIETENQTKNIYFTGNLCGRPTKKPTKAEMLGALFLHTDDDPRDGETPDEAKPRILATYDALDLPPSIIIDSGNGMQGLWLLDADYQFPELKLTKPTIRDPKKPTPEEGAYKEEVETRVAEIENRNKALAQALGTQTGTHNVDRLLRLPGTINYPNAKKRKEGRVICQSRIVRITDARYSLEDFPALEPESADDKETSRDYANADFEDIKPDDPRLKNLDEKWIALGFEGKGIAENYGGDRSRAVMAFACEAFRAGIAEEVIAACLTRWKIGDHIRDSSNHDRTLQRTLERARAFVEDSKLFEMNEQHCVLPIAGKTRVATWGDDPDFPGRKTIVSFSGFGDFRALLDKYRHSFQGEDKKGNPITVTMGLGSWWIAAPQRRQYDGGMRFMPNRDEDVVNETLNLWQGFSVAARKPEGRSGASGCALLLDHGLKIICSGDEEHFDYLMKREALIAQKRIRSEIAVGLQTEEEGTGKETWCGAFRHLYGTHAMQVQNTEHVIGKHNAHLEVLLRLTADEALFAGDPRQRNALYNLITEPLLTVEPKFIGVYTAPNYLNIDIISNAKHFIPVSGTARRFMVPKVSPDRANDHDYFNKIRTQLNDDGGYEALLYHLLYEIDIRDFNVRAVPKTAGLLDQKLASLDPEQGWWLDMLMRGILPGSGYPAPNICPAEGVFSNYIKHAQEMGVRRRSIQTKLGIFLKNNVPGLRKIDGTYETIISHYKGEEIKQEKRGNVYIFPPLAECRDAFTRTQQQKISWPDREEWEAESL